MGIGGLADRVRTPAENLAAPGCSQRGVLVRGSYIQAVPESNSLPLQIGLVREAPAALLDWFARSRRDLPWRTPAGTPRDPWKTLVSEVMSQQTRLEVVIPRFVDWMARWGSPEALAEASEDEVLEAWAGLGYYSRARNLHRTAKGIATAGWPRDASGLRTLPGVGAYTAAAIASLAWGEPVAMIDGNVIRVLARVHGLSGDLRSGRGARTLAAHAGNWIEGHDAGTINEATMELGALVCVPRSPRCDRCPLSDGCRALRDGEPERFPSPRAKASIVELRAEIAVVVAGGRILLRRAGADELLKGMWTLPEPGHLPDGFCQGVAPCGTVRHAITNHRICWHVHRSVASEAPPPHGMEWCDPIDLSMRLVSSLPRKALAVAGIRVPPATSRRAVEI